MDRRIAIIIVVLGLIVSGGFLWKLLYGEIEDGKIEFEEMTAYEELKKDYLDEQAYLKSRIVYLRGKINTEQEQMATQSAKANLDLLNDLKADIGLTEMSGKGVEITLNDGIYALRDNAKPADVDLVQASDLRDIVNVLNAGHAEAISINGQRVVAISPIISVGTTILINNSHVAPPFTINAVGDTDSMIQRVLNSPLLDALFERERKSNILFEMRVKNMINIPVYSEDFKYSYLNLVK